MEIKSVAILGAGAVGSYMIWGLSHIQDLRLCVLAEGKRAKRLKQDGCKINGEVYHIDVCTPQAARGVDLLIVCLKYGALTQALDMIEAVVDDHTVVMSLMNGVDSEDIIGKRIGYHHLVYSLIKIASHQEDGYHFDPKTTIGIVYGEKQQPYYSERILSIDQLFKKTELHYRISEHIQEEIWSKFRLNVCNNLPQAILSAGVGCYRDSEHMRFIQKGLRDELEAIALAKGIDLSKADDSSKHGSRVPPTARYSTLQDLDAKRQTEIDMFSGALIQMGKELHIPTPYNEYTYHMIKALEEKNNGLFDYSHDDQSSTQAQ